MGRDTRRECPDRRSSRLEFSGHRPVGNAAVTPPSRVLVSWHDRFLQLEYQKRIARQHLHVNADEMPGGHFVASC